MMNDKNKPKLHTVDRLTEEQIDKEWLKVKQKITRRRIRIIARYSVLTIATVLLLLVSAWGIHCYNEVKKLDAPEYTALTYPQVITVQVDDLAPVVINTGFQESAYTEQAIDKPHRLLITVPRGKTYFVKLPDGTDVWLNAESKLKYTIPFEKNGRRVELEGEAFFKVSKSEEHPFWVYTPYVTTRVMGTEFNVRSYHEDDVNVTLLEGKVAVSNNKGMVYLLPEQNAFVGQEELTVETVDVKLFTAWMDGYFYFEEASLAEIMKELGRWYNMNIEFADAELANYRFKYWAYKQGSFQEAIDIINKVGKVSVVKKGNTAIIEKNRN